MSNFPNQGTVFLEGNPVKRVSLLTDSATAHNSPKVIGGELREQIVRVEKVLREANAVTLAPKSEGQGEGHHRVQVPAGVGRGRYVRTPAMRKSFALRMKKYHAARRRAERLGD